MPIPKNPETGDYFLPPEIESGLKSMLSNFCERAQDSEFLKNQAFNRNLVRKTREQLIGNEKGFGVFYEKN